MCQIFTVQKYRFGNIILTPREMCVHELYTIESSNMTWKMKTSTRTINNYLTLTLTLNKIYFDINEKDKQQEIDNMISRYQ